MDFAQLLGNEGTEDDRVAVVTRVASLATYDVDRSTRCCTVCCKLRKKVPDGRSVQQEVEARFWLLALGSLTWPALSWTAAPLAGLRYLAAVELQRILSGLPIAVAYVLVSDSHLCPVETMRRSRRNCITLYFFLERRRFSLQELFDFLL
jgi:hypothetical protein